MESLVIYIVTNIIHTTEDKHRRGHRTHEVRKGRVQIGPRNILEGRSATFSEQMYRTYKSRIDHYLAAGMIRLTQKGEAGEVAAQEILPPAAEAPEVVMETPPAAPQDAPVEEPAPVEVLAEETEETPAEEPAPEPEPAPPVEVADFSGLDDPEVVEVAPKKRGRPPKEK